MSESQNGAVVVAHDVTRRYGEGDTAVDALAGCHGRNRACKGDGGDGPVGVGQVDADAHPRGARQADVRLGRHRRHRDHDARRQRSDEAAPRAHRLRLPVLQPAADARREGEHPAAAHHRGREAGQRVVRPARLGRRSRGSAVASPGGALRRPAAARRNRARAHLEADRAVRGRADRQSRLGHERRDSRAAPPIGRRVRPDDRDGHARRARGGSRPPRAVPRRRPASCASSASATRTRSTTYGRARRQRDQGLRFAASRGASSARSSRASRSSSASR